MNASNLRITSGQSRNLHVESETGETVLEFYRHSGRAFSVYSAEGKVGYLMRDRDDLFSASFLPLMTRVEIETEFESSAALAFTRVFLERQARELMAA